MMRRLLLVDDDESTRLICRRLLKRLAPETELEVVEATNGEEAIAALEAGRFDAVLSDYRMGVVTGIDVLDHARKRQPEALRVLMSGFADPAIVDGARRRAGIHDFIEKPMSNQEFQGLLERHLVSHLRAPR